ncbi:MAG: hypothetical protein R3E39_20690 [Anaerolineae bacterium]
MSRKKNRKHNHAPPARPRWLLPGILVGLAVVVGALVLVLVRNSQQEPYTPEVTGGPNAEVDQTVLDYGDVQFEKPVEAVFNIRNTGDSPLQILGEPRVELCRC